MAMASTNDGANWVTTFNDSISFLGTVCAGSSGAFMPTVKGTLPNYLTYRSMDEGNTWNAVDTTNAYMKGISVDGNKIYIAGSNIYSFRSIGWLNHYIRVSTDEGSIWENLVSPLDSQQALGSNPNVDTISIITSLYSAGSNLLVGMEAYNFSATLENETVAYGGGIYQLVQNGSNWVLVDSALMGRSIFGFAANGSNIFAATDSGVFRSTDNGASWTDISAGMNNSYVSSLLVSGLYLFASTANGIWKRPLSEITAVVPPARPITKSFSLSQNYPNPFNPSTIINYQLPTNSHVTLKVYDVLGREVTTLVNEREQAGTHGVKFDGTNLPSGVYFYRLQTQTYSDTKKLLLIK